jgi:hypothetical protein
LKPQPRHSTRDAAVEHLAVLVAVCGVVVFAVIVAAELAINPSLDPAQHEISEYVHAQLGPLMTVGFVFWAVSLGAMSWVLFARVGARLVATCLGVASIGMLVTATFATQTSAGKLPPGVTLTTTGRLHDIGSGLTTATLLLAALLSLRNLGGRRFRQQVAVLLVVLISSDIVLLVIGPEVAGVRQRVVVAGACIWQLLVLGAVRASSRRP